MNRKIDYLETAAFALVILAGTSLLSTHAKADVASAATAYKTKCAGCRGVDGKGKDALKTQDFASPEVQKMTDAAKDPVAETNAVTVDPTVPPQMPSFR